MREEVFICENCGTRLQENNGHMQCYICGEERENLTQLQILTYVERAKKWIYYGVYDEAKKELQVLNQYRVGGSVVYMLHLMMDMKVATQNELKHISENYQENVYFQKILKCSDENSNDFLGGTIAEYSQHAAEKKAEKDAKEERDGVIIKCVVAGILTLVMDLTVAQYQIEKNVYYLFWLIWISTLGVFFGKKKIPEKYRKFVYIGLGIVWFLFLSLLSEAGMVSEEPYFNYLPERYF